jgi:hypothetical protein
LEESAAAAADDEYMLVQNVEALDGEIRSGNSA